MYLIFDTETTGLPKRFDAPISDSDNWPRCVQIAWQLHDDMGNPVEHRDFLIKPEGYNIPYDAEQIHGISTELAETEGLPLEEVLKHFNEALQKADFVVGHNIEFDINIMGAEFYRADMQTVLMEKSILDTCTEKTAEFCQLPGGRGGRFKLPTLTELHQKLFDEEFGEAHNAVADVEATTRSFLELIRIGQFDKEELKVKEDYFRDFREINLKPIAPLGLEAINLKKASENLRKKLAKEEGTEIDDDQLTQNLEALKDQAFIHLHNHTQFSVLQSTISVPDLIQIATKDQMPAVAITDHGNMMGAFQFVREVNNYNKNLEKKIAWIRETKEKILQRLKEEEEKTLETEEEKESENKTDKSKKEPLPTMEEVLAEEEKTKLKKPLKAIVGVEFFVCEDHQNKNYKDDGYQIVFLAKNKKGYQNLIKMSSLAFTDGFYYVPRIDKEIVRKYKDDLIVLSGNLSGEIPNKILNIGEAQAEEALLWWKEEFGDDFYLEIMRHGQDDENYVNRVMMDFSVKHDIKPVAANNVYYATKEDAHAHDILLCVKSNEKQTTPIGRGRGYRFGLPNQEYYFKSSEEMKDLFKDLPQAIISTQAIVDKIEAYTLEREVLLPEFKIPEEFTDPEDEKDHGKRGENKYLKHLAFEGAKKKYGEITPEIEERLNFELSVIAETGYPGYFLIVEDLIREAKKMGVSVGPGRGSAAGSAVAYCLDITNIDPIKYDLLFERFLNPERISMPDIDIDFDDEGRNLVLEYVINKYGANQVAQIITYGTMAAKSAIRDTARVMDLPLNEADYLAKLVPDNSKLKKIFNLNDREISQKFRMEDAVNIQELRSISDSPDLKGEIISQARILEGSIRATGIHACGVIITPSDITNYVPIATAKDSDLHVTQFDNAVVESAGLLKMDFLGLKTLTLIKDTVKIVKGRHGITLDPDTFPLDDTKTFELFQRGETVGIFQYESVGMQKHLKELKPSVFEDLIAMNALYRPGPMEYIPSFIRRKHGEEPITYDLPEMEEYLQETYGITVYQEQVMLLSRKLAGFTRGEADVLRKAMGKKDEALLRILQPKFMEGGIEKEHPVAILEKIWNDWKAFASYAFNKSHSTCYAWVAYQTAYLKANYPAEFMAAVLSNNMNNIKDVTFFMEECKRMKLNVLGPDVNESYYKFSVNKDNAIRFGMGAVKGVGANAVNTIIENRKKDGPYRSIFDLAKRIDLRSANKKTFENLAQAGGFDCFTDTHRAQYFHEEDGTPFMDKILRYASRYQEMENSAQMSLFGESSGVVIPEPEVPPCEEWYTMKKLRLEKEVVGIYISGHPLDDYKNELKYFCKASISDFSNLEQHVNQTLSVAGIITSVDHRTTKDNRGWAIFTVEDFTDTYEFKIFRDDYRDFRTYLMVNNFVFFKTFIQPGWVNRDTGKAGDPRIQFKEFHQLQDIMEKFAKKINFRLPINELKKDSITTLNKIFTAHKGKKPISFTIFDTEAKIKIRLNGRNKKIDINSKLLDELQKEDFTFKIN